MSFKVASFVETRSDNPDLYNYTVRLDGYKYVLCYEKDCLREIYFIGRPSQFKGYFMSCRADFTIISHYYDINPGRYLRAVKRYEQGICNRTYFQEAPDRIFCMVDGIKRVYQLHRKPPLINSDKLQADLVAFLEQFNQRGFDKLFSPERPSEAI